MNSKSTDLLKQTLANKTDMKSVDDFDIVDVVPVPMHGDRMLRLRTLEEAFNDFDQTGETDKLSVMGYFVQVRPRKRQAQGAVSGASAAPAAPVATTASSAMASPSAHTPPTHATPSESIYLANGKLNIPYLFQSAGVLYSSGDYALARNVYKAIISSGEKTAQALFGLARCYEAEGKLEEAAINYEESITYHPQPEAYKALTALLIRQKKDQQAAEVIERALHHRQLDPSLRYEMHKTAGNCWGRLGSLREAERHYRKALEVEPGADEIRTNLGVLFLQNGRIEDAERHFQDALASNPKSHQALCGLGSCALAEGNKLAAHAWFARSLQIELKNPTAIFHLVKCAYELKSYSIAAKIVEDYIQVAPINVHLLYSLAGLQFHLGRGHDARHTCLRIQQFEPEHKGAREILRRLEQQAPHGATNSMEGILHGYAQPLAKEL